MALECSMCAAASGMLHVSYAKGSNAAASACVLFGSSIRQLCLMLLPQKILLENSAKNISNKLNHKKPKLTQMN